MITTDKRYVQDTLIVGQELKDEPFKMISPSFALPPSDLTLLTGEIHIWFAVLDRPISKVQGTVQMLSLEEQIRADKYYFERDRERYRLRHGILRTILGYYLKVEPSNLQFQYGKNGKPSLVDTFGKETLHFNISHSDGVALFAFARNHEIGVDIEHISDFPEMEQIVERFFTDREKTNFYTTSQVKRREIFFNCWTGKEAYIKALGESLSWQLNKLNMNIAPGEGDILLTIAGSPRAAGDWSIYSLKLACDYVGAFAVKSKSCKLRCFKWTPSEANRILLSKKAIHVEAV